MKLLFVHADRFECHVTEKAIMPESLRDDQRDQSFSDCVVTFVAVEAEDSDDIKGVVKGALEEIKGVYSEVSPKTILLYPYAHLSSSLASPAMALQALKMLRQGLPDIPVVSSPFGWYKKFTLQCKGHPRSEIFRSIKPEMRPSSALKFHRQGNAHPVCALIERLRQIFLSLGLNEVINPAIVDEREVYLQYGLEAPLILDRVYYLAGLDRPDVGLSDAKMAEICEISPDCDDKEKLQLFLRKFKEGKIAADDFIEEMVKELEIGEDQAKRLVENVFVELKENKARATKKTLRSHMTSLWYRTLAEMGKHHGPPLKLFSIGSRFRREQRQDLQHLYESTSASIVIMDDNLTLNDGENLTKKILRELEFGKTEFRVKAVTSNYYQPGTDTEVYANLGGKEYEVANIGFYSQESLENYGIKYPVFNLGFGVERLAMLLYDIRDIRALVFPHLYEEKTYSDEELGMLISAEKKPLSQEGERLGRKLAKVAYENRKNIGPAEVLAFESSFKGKDVKVWIYNWDEGKALMSYAALNEVYVYNGSIYGLPPNGENLKGKYLEAYRGGINTTLSFTDLIMQGFVAVLEEKIETNEKGCDIKFKDIKRPAQINLHIPDEIYKYITGMNKKIKIGGPLFFGVKAEF